MKKRAIFTLSDKGGVGKSTFARALLDHLRRFGSNFECRVLAMDGQSSMGHLANFYGIKNAAGNYELALNKMNPFQGVEAFSCVGRGIDTIGHAFQAQADILLVDMPGGAVTDVSRIYGSIEEFASVASSLGYEIVIAIVIDQLKGSARSIHQILDEWEMEGVNFIVVLNAHQAEPGTPETGLFPFYSGDMSDKVGSPRKRLLDAGGIEFVMPKFDSLAFAYYDASETPISTFATSKGITDNLNARRAEVFLNRFDLEVHSRLGLFSDSEYGESALAHFEALRKRYRRG